jgi:hypothetical protein
LKSSSPVRLAGEPAGAAAAALGCGEPGAQPTMPPSNGIKTQLRCRFIDES